MADAGDGDMLSSCECKFECGVEGVEDDVTINNVNTHPNTQHDEQEQQWQALPVIPEPVSEGDECGNVHMPLTLEELTADWPTPAKDATMDDLRSHGNAASCKHATTATSNVARPC